MSLKERKAKIAWQCRRGLLELDIIFDDILKNHLDAMTQTELDKFEKLLHYQDGDLYAWLMDLERPENKEVRDSVQFIMSLYKSKRV